MRRSPASLGTDHWEAQLFVERLASMWQAVDTLARTLRRAHADLTLAQARADALAQLVLARHTVTVHLHATVPADDTPADPAGTRDTKEEHGRGAPTRQHHGKHRDHKSATSTHEYPPTQERTAPPEAAQRRHSTADRPR